ncbi:diacylglycerol kinase family lipid kinase [Candidatus Bipolaricaulota bacterium]|nr:diacylglycerol kinase family lipid kinase [Candidatus Bipolaricaulota bacterium]
MQTKIVVNPVAGRGTSLKVLPKVKHCLDSEGVKYEIVRTRFPDHATELAGKLEASGARVVAMGGDGTVREVLNGIRSPDTPVGIIPAGMGNDFARSLGIPTDVSRATQHLVNTETKKVDLGVERGKFFNVMGVGFPAHVVERVNRYKKGPVRGPLIYLIGLLRSLTDLGNYEFHLELDGNSRTQKANAVFVTNSRFTAGGLKLVPQAKLDDGLLDVAIISGAGRMELLLALRQAYRGNHIDHPKIEFLRAKKVRIESKARLIKMFDGELEGTTPTDLEVAPRTRTIIVPEKGG